MSTKPFPGAGILGLPCALGLYFGLYFVAAIGVAAYWVCWAAIVLLFGPVGVVLWLVCLATLAACALGQRVRPAARRWRMSDHAKAALVLGALALGLVAIHLLAHFAK